MPIYEYRCQDCGHELEQLQRMSDPALTVCPACGKSQLKRLISAAGFRLKGAGWYETDFKQGNKRNLAESPAGATGEAGKSEATGSKTEVSAKPGPADGGSASPSKSAAEPAKSKSTSSSAGDTP